MSYRELRAPAAAGRARGVRLDRHRGRRRRAARCCPTAAWTWCGPAPSCSWPGPTPWPTTAGARAAVTVAGLRFVPGALPSLLGVPAAPLHNRRVALVELVPGPARAALARLEEGGDPLALLAALTARLPGAPPDRSVAALRRALPRRGPRPPGRRRAAGSRHRVGACADAGRSPPLADALGCTPRSVHRRCQAAFGYGPAVLRRVLRFRRAAALLRAGVSPAEVAAAAGYADQPHLSRETRALAGAVARSAGQRGEQVHAVAVRVEHHGVALAPERVERRQLARRARPPPARRAARPPRPGRAGRTRGWSARRAPASSPGGTNGSRPRCRTAAAAHRAARPRRAPRPSADAGTSRPNLPVEGQGLRHVRHHDPDRVQPRFSAHGRRG